MMRTRQLCRGWSAMVVTVALVVWQAACGTSDDGTPTGPGSNPNPNPNPAPTAGSIQVTTTTTGADLDPDGYSVAMNGSSDRSIGLNGVLTFTDVPAGQHQIALSGLADNCAVTGSNPASATVTAGATAPVGFDVACAGFPRGTLEITTTTSNNFDPDGYLVKVDGTVMDTVDVSGSLTIVDVSAGDQQVELADIAPNCAVSGSNPRSVTIPDADTASLSFSVACTSPPDGRIIFKEIFQFTAAWHSVMNSDGSGLLHLMEMLGCCREDAAWSPDGNKIAFDSEGLPGADIYVMNKDASALTQITSGPADDSEPAWSPDGAWIVFTRGPFNTGPYGLWIVKSDGTGVPTQLTNNPGSWDSQPSWSPDGAKIAFSGSSSSSNETTIQVINADGTGLTALTGPQPICNVGPLQGSPALYDTRPDWSPDGTKIVFEREDACTPQGMPSEYDIFVMNADGTSAVNLTPSPSYHHRPSWSPDGSRIVFSNSAVDIWVMNADGTGKTAITQSSPNHWFEDPDWGP